MSFILNDPKVPYKNKKKQAEVELPYFVMKHDNSSISLLWYAPQ